MTQHNTQTIERSGSSEDAVLQELQRFVEHQCRQTQAVVHGSSHAEQATESDHSFLADLLREFDAPADADRKAMFAGYLADLAAVARMPSGAGLRVLRRWLDEACAFDRLHVEAPQIYAVTALADYAKDRMAEVAMADPVACVRLQLAGAKQSVGMQTV